MALQLSTTVRTAKAGAIEGAVGTAPILRIYDLTAGAPANCAASITGTLLAEMTLPSDWLGSASAGAVAMTGTWSDTSADGTGTADFFRIYASDGTTCHMQGTVSTTGADLNLVNTSIAATQPVSITSFTLTEANA